MNDSRYINGLSNGFLNNFAPNVNLNSYGHRCKEISDVNLHNYILFVGDNVCLSYHIPVEETFPGSRSQRKNIKAIFIQNIYGERFKYPFIHPAGAFAMAQHVDHGGVPHDPAGKAIISMSEQIAQLQEFQRKIQHQTLHDDAMGISERAVGKLQELKARMEALSKRQPIESRRITMGQAVFDFSGTTTVITGGASGIGLTCAELFAVS